MGLTGGVISLAIGLIAFFFCLPRGGQVRPWLNHRLGLALAPTVVMTFVVLGLAFIITGL